MSEFQTIKHEPQACPACAYVFDCSSPVLARGSSPRSGDLHPLCDQNGNEIGKLLVTDEIEVVV